MNIELNGQEVTIDGAPAGTFDGTDYTALPEMKRAQVNAVAKFLNNLIAGEPEPDAGAESAASPPTPPACPPMDPALGDKTPEVVEWYRDHDPEEYQRRYRGRKTHLGRIG